MFDTHRIFVLVADGGGARLFRRANHAAALVPVRTLAPSEAPKAADGDASGPPRRDKVVASDESPRDHVKSRFAHELAALLEADDAQFDELVVVAPPRFLGELRADFAPSTARKVKTELPLDLTRVPEHELGARLHA